MNSADAPADSRQQHSELNKATLEVASANPACPRVEWRTIA